MLRERRRDDDGHLGSTDASGGPSGEKTHT